ncbi:hypothetical protein Q5752_002512 [Cryptotrichosporon argae]
MITLTPLSASAASSSSSEPVCYFLELDGARILLDLGQRDYRASAARGDWSYEEKVRELAPTLSLVLLSHSPAPYLSLYPYARAHWGLKCPVYATQPTVEMGRVVCLSEAESWRAECAVPMDEDEDDEAGGGADAHADGAENANGAGAIEVDGEEQQQRQQGKRRRLKGPFVPTVEEIHEAFDWIKAIRYNQPLHLGGDLSHLLLTPFPSGHVLGGTLFKIRSPTSGTILYAVGMNHTGERHVDGLVTGQRGAAGYADDIRRPDVLLVEAGRADIVAAKRRAREAALLDVVNATLENDRSVLMPCDAAPRLLELLVLLDQHWHFKASRDRRWNYPLCLVSRTAQDMAAFARSLIEWMGGVVREGDDVLESRRNKRRQVVSEHGVLDFRHVRFFDTPAALLQAHGLGQPKVVLAVPPSLSHGPSRWLFTAMAGQAGNAIVLTTRGEDGTLGRTLYDAWVAATGTAWGTGALGPAAVPALPGLQVEMDAKVPLAGAELEAHVEAERARKEREHAQAAAAERGRRMLEADDLDSDSDDSDAGEVDGMLERGAGASGRGGAADADGAGANANAFAGETDDRQMSFDIFVKGQQTRTAGRGATTDGATRFRMFPMVARGRKVDAYGEGLDIGQWVRKGREIEEEGETEEVRAAKRKKEEEEDKAKQPPEPPSKFVSETVDVALRASVWYVDMEGQHDGQAIKTIVSDLQPRKLVLVRSTPGPTQTLLNFFSPRFAPTDVFCTSTGERVTVGEHVQSYSLQLGDSIAGLVKWSRFEGYDVAMVDGKIAFAAGSTVPTLEAGTVVLPPAAPEPKPEADGDGGGEGAGEGARVDAVTEEVAVKTEAEATGEAGATAEAIADGTVVAVPAAAERAPASSPSSPASAPSAKRPIETRATAAAARAPLPLPTSLYIGDLRLLVLKARLGALPVPIPAEFAGEGTLLCGPGLGDVHAAKAQTRAGQVVAVRKVGEGEVTIEGAAGKVYYDVRRELYASYAQVMRA